MRNVLWILVTASFVALPAQANVVRLGGQQPNCVGGMQENVTVNVNFNIRADSFADAKQKFDQKIQQVTDFAKQQNIPKFEMQSMNYNINSQMNYENGAQEQFYQLGGNASYMLDSSDSAFKLGEFLTKQKFQVSINASKYRNNNCANPAIMNAE